LDGRLTTFHGEAVVKYYLGLQIWMGFLACIYKRKDVGQIQMVQDMVQLQDLVNMAITCHILWVRNFVAIFSR
jgi:hypothetical protein